MAYKRLLDNGWDIDGYNDHGTHIALYLHDPDFNGIELAWDRDPSEWPKWQGVSNDVALQRMQDGHRRLDLKALLAEADKPEITRGSRPGISTRLTVSPSCVEESLVNGPPPQDQENDPLKRSLDKLGMTGVGWCSRRPGLPPRRPAVNGSGSQGQPPAGIDGPSKRLAP